MRNFIQNLSKTELLSSTQVFFETVKKSCTTYKEEKKTLKTISVLERNHQALGLFAFKCTDDKAAFHNPLTTYPLVITDPSGTFYQPATKHSFRNKII